jgi:hypothetical protein
MKLNQLFVLFGLFVLNVTVAQVQIPGNYMSRFPYYIGNTRLEIEQYLGKNNRYLVFTVDTAQIDTTGNTDASVIIQSLIDKAALETGPDTFVTVLLPAGRLRIEQTLNIPSHVMLKGRGSRTTLLLATGENRHGISISPANLAPLFTLALARDAGRGSREIWVDKQKLLDYTALHGMPRYLMLRRLDDQDLITSSWAKGSVSEHYYVGEVRDSGSYSIIRLAHPLFALETRPSGEHVSIATRTDFRADSNFSELCFLPYVEAAGISCIRLQRMDSTVSQTSNIMLDQAYNCVVSEVDGLKTNFAHVCVNNSAFNIIKRCAFRQGFGYGGGGRAYGVVLQMGSSSNVVVDNYFDKLRHSMLLQAGANNNVLFANMSVNTFWSEFPADASGDIVLHGNYVYANLVEMNSVQQLVIDDSHGKNGPHNLFYRNQFRNYGVLMRVANGSDSQVFFANEIIGTGGLKGLFLLKDNGHFVYGNRVQGQLAQGQDDVAYPGFIFQPPCYVLGKISPVCFSTNGPAYGAPFNPADDLLPAARRKEADDTSGCVAAYDVQYAYTSSLYKETAPPEVFLFYPNPATNQIRVEVIHAGVLSVFNSRTELMQSFDLLPGSHVLNLEGFPHGFYILRYADVQGMSAAKILVE